MNVFYTERVLYLRGLFQRKDRLVFVRRPPRLSACEARVAQGDRGRFLTALFAPDAIWEDLLVLYAFNLEIAKLRETVTEPMLGRIRLQWWRETLSEIFAGQAPRRHEVALPLADMIYRRKLPFEAFDALIGGREQDFELLPPTTEAEFSAYVEATGGQLGRLAGLICGADPEQAAAAARAYAGVGLLVSLPRRAGLGRVDLPLDRLASAGLTASEIRAGRPSAALAHLVLDFVTRIESDLDALGPAPRRGRAALLPAALARRLIRRLRATDGDPHRAIAAIRARPDALLPFHLWRAMRKQRL